MPTASRGWSPGRGRRWPTARHEASILLREGLGLWRGPPLADLAFEAFAQDEIARLEELRLTALEERIDADLALGRHAELVAELEALVGREPLRERLRGQLMLALYRGGRQAEALQVYAEGDGCSESSASSRAARCSTWSRRSSARTPRSTSSWSGIGRNPSPPAPGLRPAACSSGESESSERSSARSTTPCRAADGLC